MVIAIGERCGRGVCHPLPMNPPSPMEVIIHLNAGEGSWDDWFYAHPHPGPLPRGEGEMVAASWQKDGALVHEFNARILRGILIPALSRPSRSERDYGATGWRGNSRWPPV